MNGRAAERTLTLQLPNRLSVIGETADDIAAFLRGHGVSERAIGHLALALDEAMTNTIAYAWPEGGAHELTLAIEVADGLVVAVLSDDGIAFDPLEIPPPDLESSLEDRPIGGLGVHFMTTLMDEVTYRREGERNVLTLRKRAVAG
ncbi:MAG: ATP-binding protein [Rhizobiales bacterium]|nr:ATP-binding protein [Hyphomicrobiales bacterium]